MFHQCNVLASFKLSLPLTKHHKAMLPAAVGATLLTRLSVLFGVPPPPPSPPQWRGWLGFSGLGGPSLAVA